MKTTIVIINTYPKFDAVFAPLADELRMTVRTFPGIRPMVEDLNAKVLSVADLAMVIVTGAPEEKDPGLYRKNTALLSQLAVHSKLKFIPVLFLGIGGNAALSEQCTGIGAAYLALPVKKSELMERIRGLMSSGPSATSPGARERELSPGPGAVLAPRPPLTQGAGEMRDQTIASESGVKAAMEPAESERRVATVMFADISGFTAMSEKMDPEEVTGVMNQCFEMLGVHIERNGGHIDKFIGDCVMVCFGIPKALENAPLSAVNTAIAMRNGLYQFNTERALAIPLDIHIGINTGMVVSGTVGSAGRKDYTVMGDAVNLASRIEGASVRGQILVGPDTYRATQGDIEYRSLEPVALKGKAEPVPVYEVVSLREATARRRSVEERVNAGPSTGPRTGPERMIYSEMVGRDAEMNLLRHCVTGLVMGTGGIVNVIGEAGIGKSRLMAELKSDPAMKQVTLLEGQAISMGRNLSFHPVIDLLKNWAGIREDDGDAAQLSKLETAVRAVHPGEAGEIIPFVATLMGMKLGEKYADRLKGIEGEALEKLIFKNVRELLIKGAELRPMIVRIEDLHWADTSSIELLSSLFRLASTHRILFLNFFRPNYEETGDRVVKTLREEYGGEEPTTDHTSLPASPHQGGMGIYTEITIHPLDESQSAALIANLLNIRGLPQTLKSQITERAGGNPFFIEEVLRSLIDDGAVVRTDDSFMVTEKINTVTVPLTINEVLMSRIDRLDEETRNLLKTASVIGRYFFYKIIAQVAGNISDIDSRLGHLEDIQLIRERKRMDELEYLFKHALAQEAAYESLLIQKRKELHLLVAQAIENVFNERLHEFYGMLAYHYSMGENMDKAEEYMLRAGEEAMKAAANNEAIDYFKSALQIYISKYGKGYYSDKMASLEKELAQVLFSKGFHSEAILYFNKLLAYYGERALKNPLIIAPMTACYFIKFIIYLEFPSLQGKTKPTATEAESFKIHCQKTAALLNTDPKGFIVEMFQSVNKLMMYDMNSIEKGYSLLSDVSMAFAFPGISLGVSEKILSRTAGKIDPDDLTSHARRELSVSLFKYFKGQWIGIKYDHVLVDEGIKRADTFITSNYLIWTGRILLEIADFKELEYGLEKLAAISSLFNCEFTESIRRFLKVLYLYKIRSLDLALEEVTAGVEYLSRTSFIMLRLGLCSLKASVEVHLGKIDDARLTLGAAKEINDGIRSYPVYRALYYLAHAYYELRMFENNPPGQGRVETELHLKRCIKYARQSLSVSGKVAAAVTESLRLMGTCHWLMGKPRKALRWWKKSIDEGERLGARLELARTYFEAGKRLSLPSPHGGVDRHTVQKIIGLYAGECLDTAKTLFTEMDLQWDLAELEKVRRGIS